MMDDLDLVFEEDPDRGRHRHRRSSATKRKKKKRRGRGRTILALFLVLLLLGGLGFGAWYGFDRIQGYFTTPDYNSSGVGEVTIEVKKDETATDIANTLYREGVVKSAKAFVDAANLNPRSRNIEPGVYKLRKQMRASDALAMLLDTNSKVVTKITIPEGRTALATYKILAEKTGLKVEDFVAAGKDPIKLGIPDFWFKRTDGKTPAPPSVEGFLFPATYEFSPGATAAEVLSTMVGQFITVATELKFVERVQAERGGIAPYEALITASLAQAEAGVPEDIGKIARVAYNRVYKRDMPLQFDVTVNYWWELTGQPTKSSGQMTQSDLHNPKNPYNTHDFLGLPPTPINNPGRTALEGAMAPPAGEWIFFVAIDQAGHSAFASTDAEHERNKRTACQNGVLRC
jgi:peptidoglycan lytic transglycosylase G